MSPTSYRAAPPRNLSVTSLAGQGQTRQPVSGSFCSEAHEGSAGRILVLFHITDWEHLLPRCALARLLPRMSAPVLCFAAALVVTGHSTFAQNDRRIPVRGYVTASHLPDSFDVNDLHVSLSPSTQYGLIAKPESSTQSPLRDALQAGAYVEVTGTFDKHTRTTAAQTVYLRDDWDQKLSGLGVIDKVLSSGPQLVVRADGYRIRIAADTQVSYAGDLKSLDALTPNMWLHYEGRRDNSGILIATRVTLLPARSTHFKAIPGLEITTRDVIAEIFPDRKPSSTYPL